MDDLLQEIEINIYDLKNLSVKNKEGIKNRSSEFENDENKDEIH